MRLEAIDCVLGVLVDPDGVEASQLLEAVAWVKAWRVEAEDPAPTLTPAEAVMGFVVWITGRKEVVSAGGDEAVGAMMEVLKKFSAANKLGDCRDSWPAGLVYEHDWDALEGKNSCD